MTEQQDVSIQFKAQYVKDLSFEAPHLPGILETLTQPPKIDVNIGVNANKTKDEDVFEVILTLKAHATNADDKKTVFLCELSYAAVVQINVPKEMCQPILLIEVPHLVFPFARALVANITREAGFPALQIAPIDFATLYKQKSEAQHEKESHSHA